MFRGSAQQQQAAAAAGADRQWQQAAAAAGDSDSRRQQQWQMQRQQVAVKQRQQRAAQAEAPSCSYSNGCNDVSGRAEHSRQQLRTRGWREHLAAKAGVDGGGHGHSHPVGTTKQ